MKYQWLVIITSLFIAIVSPRYYSAGAGILMLLIYSYCKKWQWSVFQLFLAYLFGGMATGVGFKLLIYYGVTDQAVPMIIAPSLIWLFTRALFLYFEERYSLKPRKLENIDLAAIASMEAHQGISAWSGDSSGRASIPDETGRYLLWNFYGTGEIAMGGPTYGEAIFSNQCAFSGVGPSIVVSEDGRYAAMTLPSRSSWGLLLADLQNKRVYLPKSGSDLWEIDRIENDMIYGRHSPLVSNLNLGLSIGKVLAEATKLDLVNDDGWWVIDYEGRKPFPRYEAVTIFSSGKAHRITFVPDLEPFKRNPFERYRHPEYSVLVDDYLLDARVGGPYADWANGKLAGEEGRYLLFADKLLDCFDPVKQAFDIKTATRLKHLHWTDNTNVAIDNFSDGGNGILIAEGKVRPRSTGFTEAVYAITSTTSPWDENDIDYWDLAGNKQHQQRNRIERRLLFEIDLLKYAATQTLPLASIVKLVNRVNPAHTAQLMPAKAFDLTMPYAGYQCLTSCDIDVGLVTDEAIWSHCGRYLAIVMYAPKPDVPRQLKIIDFKQASVYDVPGSYVLPSFIWFDETMLDLTHIVALQESATAHNPWQQYANRINVDDFKPQNDLYDLLFTSQPARRAAMEVKANSMQTGDGYSSGSVDSIAQHCILFAPDFSRPILQPPKA